MVWNTFWNGTTNLIWGDGTEGTSVYENTKVKAEQTVVVPVYGSLQAEQDVHSGTYFDRVTVTIEILK